MREGSGPILLCTDLDRTLLPNGAQEESPEARPRFRDIAARPEVTLCYVTGRHRTLINAAIEEYALPAPDYAIGDVGTSIYEISEGHWNKWDAWDHQIAQDWNGRSRGDLEALLGGITELKPQEPSKQNDYKLSYYLPIEANRDSALENARLLLKEQGVRASLIWSIDDAMNVGLLDVLPERATKLHAIEFLMREKGFAVERTVFSGDSGNDLPALTSGLQAVLVRNAREDVRELAIRLSAEAGHRAKLYLARGGWMGMNGYYAAGVVEGLAHFIPEALDWMSSGKRFKGT